jgi:phosphoadenosine phosphosulfate reductase
MLQAPDAIAAAEIRGPAERLDRRLAALGTPEERIAAIADAVPGRLTFSTSLGPEDQAVLHAVELSGAAVDIFTLDTGRLFPETLETLVRTEQRYGLRIRVISPAANEVEQLVARDGVLGFRLSSDARKACCHVRKVRPLARALHGAAGWITGLRHGQSSGREGIRFAAWDNAYGLMKVNPLADWPLQRLEDYLAANDVPVNPLHARGFPSIGCQPCTRAVKPGEDIRAGRWWWENEDGKECGLHSRSRVAAGASA